MTKKYHITGDRNALLPFSWQSCGAESDAFQLTSLSVDPDPPIRGRKFTVNIKGYLSKSIGPGDVAKVVIKYGGFTLVNMYFNICDNLHKLDPGKFKCPIPAGNFDVSHSEFLPVEIPPGKYQIHVEAYSSSQFTGIVCLDAEFKISSISNPSANMNVDQDKLTSLQKALAEIILAESSGLE